MTEAQALREARTRWGGEAQVERERDRSGDTWYRVGVREKALFRVLGDSRLSWEDAFRDAERRTNR